MRYGLSLIFIFLFILPTSTPAQDTPFHVTPYALPRFVTLGADEVNARTGPGPKYPVSWVYARKGLPVEVVLEYDVWRKIRDHEGEGGWVHSSLLSGRRAGVIQGPDLVPLRAKPDGKSKLRARLAKGSIVRLDECVTGWCAVETQGYKGWVQRNFIWGIYADEIFD